MHFKAIALVSNCFNLQIVLVCREIAATFYEYGLLRYAELWTLTMNNKTAWRRQAKNQKMVIQRCMGIWFKCGYQLA